MKYSRDGGVYDKKVGRLLYADEHCREFLVETSREIDTLLSLMEP